MNGGRHVVQELYTLERKMHMLDRLAWSEMFENFLANKFTAAKRFGLEGCETLVPGMKAMIDLSADLGVQSICMGMPHRGKPRLRMHLCGLHQVCKPAWQGVGVQYFVAE